MGGATVWLEFAKTDMYCLYLQDKPVYRQYIPSTSTYRTNLYTNNISLVPILTGQTCIQTMSLHCLHLLGNLYTETLSPTASQMDLQNKDSWYKDCIIATSNKWTPAPAPLLRELRKTIPTAMVQLLLARACVLNSIHKWGFIARMYKDQICDAIKDVVS